MQKITFARIGLIILVLTFILPGRLLGQNSMPEIMQNGTLDEQMTYVNDRTRIYENYRAIREDIFQQMKNNALDSLKSGKLEINNLRQVQSELEKSISDFELQLSNLNNDLEQAVSNRDSLLLFGMKMTKSSYNRLLWSIIIGLIILTGFVMMLFKRGNVVTRSAKTDLEDIKKEFEEFRRVAHLNKEKLIVSHFNEIKKLKEMGR